MSESVTVDVDITVICYQCDSELEISLTREEGVVVVEPCSTCLEETEEKADSQGYERGKADHGDC